MAADKTALASVMAAKRAKANAQYNEVLQYLRTIRSASELDVVREQKLLLGLPKTVLEQACMLFAQAAEETMEARELLSAQNYARFVPHVACMQEQIESEFDARLQDVASFTLGDVSCALDEWLEESYLHISNQVWKHSTPTIESLRNAAPARAAACEESLQTQVGNTNEIVFAGARLMNEIASRMGCTAQSQIGRRKRNHLKDQLPDLIMLAQRWNGTQFALDKVSYGEWIVTFIAENECHFDHKDPRLEKSRVLALRRSIVQRIVQSRSFDPNSSHIAKYLTDLLPHFLTLALDRLTENWQIDLSSPLYWDLHAKLVRRLSELGPEDDILFSASEDSGRLVLSDYIASACIRWYYEIYAFLAARTSKRRLRNFSLPPLTIASLAELIPLAPDYLANVRNSLKYFCTALPRKSCYSILDNPFVLLDDGSIIRIGALDAGQWTVAVRSRWMQMGGISSRYGHLWEDYVISRLGKKGWTVLGKNINLSGRQEEHCEIDILIGRDDVCLLVQMKSFAGQGTNMYDHWRNRQVIEKGIQQALSAGKRLSAGYRLSNIVGKSAARSVKIIRPLVLSTLHYFNGWEADGVSVVSIDALANLMRGAHIAYCTFASGGAVGSDLREPLELTGARLLEFLDHPVDWRIAQETGSAYKKDIEVGAVKWSIPFFGSEEDPPFELHP